MILLAACALTLLIEVPFLALCGYRDREEIAVTALANVVTNLTLNLLFQLAVLPYRIPVILAAEAVVVLAEFGLYALAFGASGRLFLLTLAANVLSFGTGVILSVLR